MIFDFDYATFVGGVVIYPDFPFAHLPRQASDIKETVSLGGGSSTSNANLKGSTDSVD